MKLFDRKPKTRAEPKSYTALWLKGEDDMDGSLICPSGYQPLSRNEEILRCVYKIADLVSNMTIMLMQNSDNGDIRIKNALSRKIDIDPSKIMTTRKNFIFKVVTDMCLYGNSVVYPRTKKDLIDDLELWNADSCIFRKKYELDEYVVIYKGQSFESDEVLHFVLNPAPDEPYKGLGIAPLLLNTIGDLVQENTTKKAFLKSKWKPSLVIAINSDIEELRDKELREQILGSYTDTTNAGEPWLIPAGELKIDTIKPLTLNDLAISESIKLDRQAVAAAFSMPAYMVGIGEFDKEEYNNFISTTIMSFAMIIQQTLTKGLLYSPDLYFKLSPKSLMQYSLSEKANFVTEMVHSGMLNKNEGRCEFDYSPADDPAMNEYQVLENYIPVSRIGDQKKLKGGDENNGET